MTPERWQQVDEIFQAAIELDLAERVSFLETSCAGDEELRREVESLITSDEQGLSVAESPAYEVAAGLLLCEAPELHEGHQIGHYQIVSLLGAGGMGEVYLAQDTTLHLLNSVLLFLIHFLEFHDIFSLPYDRESPSPIPVSIRLLKGVFVRLASYNCHHATSCYASLPASPRRFCTCLTVQVGDPQ